MDISPKLSVPLKTFLSVYPRIGHVVSIQSDATDAYLDTLNAASLKRSQVRSYFESAVEGDLSSVRDLIINQEVEVDPIDHNGETPLLHAVLNGHEATALFLSSMGADPFKKTHKGDDPYQNASDLGLSALLEAWSPIRPGQWSSLAQKG